MKSRRNLSLNKIVSVIIALVLFVGLLPAQAISASVGNLYITVGAMGEAKELLDSEMTESGTGNSFSPLPDLTDLELPETYQYNELFPEYIYIPLDERTPAESSGLDSTPPIENLQLPEIGEPTPEEHARMVQLMKILGSSTYFSEISEQDLEFVCLLLNVSEESMRGLEALGLKVTESLQYARLMTAYGFPADRLLNEYPTQEDCIELELKMSGYLLILSQQLVGTELDLKMRECLFDGMTFDKVQSIFAISRTLDISMDALLEDHVGEINFPEWMSELDIQNYQLLAADLDIFAQVLVNYAVEHDLKFHQLEMQIEQGQHHICELFSNDDEVHKIEPFSVPNEGIDVDKYIAAPYSYSRSDSESVNLNNGALVYERVDTVIPGRNGLNLVIGRRFDSSDAGIYAPTSELYGSSIYAYVVNYGYKAYWRNEYGEGPWSFFDAGPFYETFQSRSSATAFIASLKTIIERDFNNQTPPTDLILKPYSNIEQVKIGEDYYYESATTANNYLRDLYGLGQGWSFMFSSIENGRYLHLADGRTLDISITSSAGDSNLKDYTLKDLRIERESGKYSNGTVSSSYTLYYKDGKQEFFSSDGKLIGIQDCFGSTIKFVNTTVNSLPCITITDTLGRNIIISGTGAVGTHTMTVKLPDNNNMRYIAEPILGHNAYSMAKCQNQLEVTTSYSYSIASGGFNVFSKNTSAKTNYYLNLITITHPTNAQTKYEYEKMTHNLGTSGLYESYRIKSRMDCIGTRVYNNQLFSYSSNNSSGHPNSYNPSALPATYEYSTTVTDNGLTAVHTFNHQHLRTNVDLKISGISKQQTMFEYSNDKLPIKQIIRTYGSGSMYMEDIELYTYDSFGNVLTYHDPQAKGNASNTENKTEFSYDSRYQVLTTKKYKRDAATSIREEYELYPDGKTPRWHRIYENNNLKSETEYIYDAYGNVILQSVGGIRVTNFEYKNGGPLTRTYTTGVMDADGTLVASRPGNDMGIIDVNYQYDNMSNITAHIDGNGAVTSYIYDKTNRITRNDYPNGSNRQYSYSDTENTLRVTDENGVAMMYGYDALGKLAYVRDVYTGNNLKQYVYDDKQRLETEIYPNGSQQGYFIEYDYDAFDRVLAKGTFDDENDELVLKDTFIYDYGNCRLTVLSALDASEGRSYSTKWEYDYAGRAIKEMNILGQYSSAEYNGAGDKVKDIDPKGSTTEYRYDALGRLLEVRLPFDSRTAYTEYYYDRNDNIVKKTTDTKAEAYAYDMRGNLLTANVGDGILTTYTRDNLGNILTMKNGSNQVTRYTYDRFGNVLTMTDPLGQIEQYHYDLYSNLLEKNERNGTDIKYTRDGLGREKMVTAYMRNGSDNTFIQTNYYLTGAVIGEENGYGLSYYEYDETGSLIFENTEETTKTYEYNIGKLRTYFTLQIGSAKLENSYEYDALGRLERVTGSGTTATYTYDANGNLDTRTYGNGVVTTYTYNKAHLITEVLNKKDSDVLSQYTYSYYLDGNTATKTDNTGKMTAYTYNAAGALTREEELQGAIALRTYDYAYDGSNNRKEMSVTGVENYITTYKYDANNRLRNETRVEAGNVYAADYYYDPNGNMVSSVRGAMSPTMGVVPALNLDQSLDGITFYEYDGFNRETEMRTEGMKMRYRYMPNGLLGFKVVNGTLTDYGWDGNQIVLEHTSGAEAAKYIRGINLVASITDETPAYYLYNAHGDVEQLTNSSGAVTKEYDYDAFGNECAPSDTDPNPFRYCGEYYDTSSGTYYLRARYYEPTIGRFLAEDTHWNPINMIYGDTPIKWNERQTELSDPLGLNIYTYIPDITAIMQSGNLYVYGMNNPIRYVDPTGELAWPGEIHNQVMYRVAIRDGLYTEQRIDYSFGWGRADLISPTGAVWDVKRDKPRQIAAGVTQVQKYVANTWRYNPGMPLSVGGVVRPGAFVYESGLTTYYVTYRYAGQGVIAYDYRSVTDWQKVGEVAVGIVIIAGATYLIYQTGGAAAPILVPLISN
jgi:RHS repeat-associated protein